MIHGGGFQHLFHPVRLQAVAESGLLDSAPDEGLDALTRLAAELMAAPIALVGVLDDKREYLKSFFGLGEPWASRREVPLTATLCCFVVETGAPLFIENILEHPLAARLPGAIAAGARAYAGHPLRVAGGEVVGTLCAIDTASRPWTPRQRIQLAELAGIAMHEIGTERLKLRVDQLESGRQAEQALRDSEVLFRLMFEQNPEAMWVIDRDTRRFLAVNDATLLQYGYTRDEFLRLRSDTIENTQCDAGLLTDDVRAGGDAVPGGESRHRHRDGRELIVRLRAHAMDFRGRSALLVVAHDVTELRKSDAHLRMLERAVEHLNEFVMITEAAPLEDPGPKILMVKGAFERITGFAAAEAVGQTPAFLVSPRTCRAALRRMVQGIRGGQAAHVELIAHRRDGTPFWLELETVPVSMPGGSTRWLVVTGRDATERRTLEQKLKKHENLESMGRLTGGIAHHFNNLLATILGFTEVLATSLPEGDPMTADLHEIRRAAERGAALTRELLSVGRRQALQPRQLDLAAELRRLEPELQRRLGEAIAVDWQIEAHVDTVSFDPEQLEYIVMTLADFARSAMPDGGRLRVAVSPREVPDEAGLAIQPGSYAVLSFSDSGPGLAPEVRAQLFQPFSACGAGSTRSLGLAALEGVVEQAGGFVAVESGPGRGTRVDVALPVARQPEESTAQTEGGRVAGTETVLLAEDEEPLRRVLSAALRKWGYRVLEARDGAEALQIQRTFANDIDLLVTDVVMPHVDGRALAEQLARDRPGIRILFISGHVENIFADRANPFERSAFLAKPFTPERLARRIRGLLDEAGTRGVGARH